MFFHHRKEEEKEEKIKEKEQVGTFTPWRGVRRVDPTRRYSVMGVNNESAIAHETTTPANVRPSTRAY